jgi:radical SAM protein with 4Fe4S-binding SPASM domain
MNDLFLGKKRDNEQEYTLHLFTFCNLSCSFCWQDHDDMVGIDTVLDKLPIVESLLNAETKRSVVFNIMGGEVFAPQIFNDTLVDTYVTLTKEISRMCKERGIKANLNWVTNLVIDDRQYLDRFLGEVEDLDCDTSLTVSYDPKGRFNQKQFNLFKKNLVYYGPDDVRSISLLMTKQNIAHFLKDQDEFFKWAYASGFKMYFDYLMPDSKTEAAPSDTDLFTMFKFMIDNYPKTEPVSEWLKRTPQALSCRSSKLILEDGTICGCGNLIDKDVAEEIYETPLDSTSNEGIESRFLEKYNCMSCEYFSRCQLGCFMQHNYRFREEMDECVYKATHRYIDSLYQPNRRLIDIIEVT